MITKYATNCCAFCQLSMSSDATIEEIQEALDLLKEERRSQIWYGTGTDAGGQTSTFTITTPSEKELAEKLESLGYKKVNEFDRRNGYPSTGILSMWVYNIPDCKRIFGNPLLGTWSDDDKIYLTVKELEEKQDEFQWKCSNPEYPNNLYPYYDGKPLMYDEEV